MTANPSLEEIIGYSNEEIEGASRQVAVGILGKAIDLAGQGAGLYEGFELPEVFEKFDFGEEYLRFYEMCCGEVARALHDILEPAIEGFLREWYPESEKPRGGFFVPGYTFLHESTDLILRWIESDD